MRFWGIFIVSYLAAQFWADSVFADSVWGAKLERKVLQVPLYPYEEKDPSTLKVARELTPDEENRQRALKALENEGPLDCMANQKKPGIRKIGSACFPCSRVRLLTSCANGFDQSGYGSWSDKTPVDAVFRKADLAGKRGLLIIDVNPHDNMVRVRQDGSDQAYWVNADTLACNAGKEVPRYTRMIEIPPSGNVWFECLREANALPSVPYGLRDAAREASHPLLKSAISRAKEAADKFQTQARVDFGKLYVAFRCSDSQHKDSKYVDGKLTCHGDKFTTSETRLTILRNALYRINAINARMGEVFGFDPQCKTRVVSKLDEINRERARRQCVTFRRTLASLETLLSRRGKLPNFLKSDDDSEDDPLFRGNPELISMDFETYYADFAGPAPDYIDLEGRIALFYGLGLDGNGRKTEAQAKLKASIQHRVSIELTAAERSVGQTPGMPLDDLNNGYLFGGKGSDGVDCSQFVADAFRVPPLGDKIPRTTDFDALARYNAHEYPWHLNSKFGNLKNCFKTIDLRAGEWPQPGDLVVVRHEPAGQGHVVMVTKFDSMSGTVDTIEAAGGEMYGVGTHKRPLYEPQCMGTGLPNEGTPLRGGLHVMRYVGNDDNCPLRP